jgi:hypothetical protein
VLAEEVRVSLAGAEIPGSDGPPKEHGGNEALPAITKLNRSLYLLVLYILGIALVLLIIGWIVITAVGKTVPEGLPVVIATIVGALVGVIASEKASS